MFDRNGMMMRDKFRKWMLKLQRHISYSNVALVEKEYNRQKNNVELIASEN